VGEWRGGGEEGRRGGGEEGRRRRRSGAEVVKVVGRSRFDVEPV
jgi:hypothetical protein